MSESSFPRRTTAGVPGGGQFATSARREATVSALPVLLETAVPDDGSYDLSRTEAGSSLFDRVSVRRHPLLDSFRAYGAVDVDLIGGVADQRQCGRDEAQAWLVQHEQTIDDHLYDRYDSGISTDTDEPYATLSTFVTVPCDARLDDALDVLESSTARQRLAVALEGIDTPEAHSLFTSIARAVERAENAVYVDPDDFDPSVKAGPARRMDAEYWERFDD